MKNSFFLFTLISFLGFLIYFNVGIPSNVTNNSSYFFIGDSLNPLTPPALSPEQSLLAFHVPSGYHMELVASEPMIKEPVAIAWDGNARMYVAQMETYTQDADGTDTKKRKKYKNQINQEDEWLIVSQESRSQLKNKSLAIKRFKELLKDALIMPKVRKPTQPPKDIIEDRLKSKKLLGLKKENRSKINLPE